MHINIGGSTFNNEKHLAFSDIAGKGWTGKKHETVMGKPQAPSCHFCLQLHRTAVEYALPSMIL